MFTGIVEETGRVTWLRRSSESGLQLQITASAIVRGLHRGDSVAVNGCCLTVSAHRPETVTFNLLQETLDCTNLGKLRPDSMVNLERAMPADGRFNGHFVQGHIDTASEVVRFEKQGDDYRLDVALPPGQAQYIIHKGSIAVNGISLTVAELDDAVFTAWIIPHTRRSTNLQSLQAGDRVNLEFDVMAKYAERVITRMYPPAAPRYTDRDLG